MKNKYLYTAAFLNLLLAVFHVLFWWLFNWPQALECLRPADAGIIQMLNVVVCYLLFFMAFITFRQAGKPVLEPTDKALLVFMAGFYFLRAGFGGVFFAITAIEVFIWIFCLIAALAHLAGARRFGTA